MASGLAAIDRLMKDSDMNTNSRPPTGKVRQVRRRGWYRKLAWHTERVSRKIEQYRYSGFAFLKPTRDELFDMPALPWSRTWRVAARGVGFDMSRLTHEEACFFYD